MKINLYYTYLTRIFVAGSLAYDEVAQIFPATCVKPLTAKRSGSIDAVGKYKFIKPFSCLFPVNIFLYKALSNLFNKQNYPNTKAPGIYPCIVMMLVMALAFTPLTYATVTGPGPSWLFARKISLNTATPLANFQVKVTLAAGQYTNMNAAGNDLRFYDINNNLCNYWIETWNNAGTSTIWVNVPTSGANALYLYYGNAAAPAASNGAAVFDFFDDFTGTSLAANWATNTANGSIAVSGGQVTISVTSSGGSITSPGIASVFTPSSTSFVLETKHTEGAYNRNRFYVASSAFPTNPLGFDNGYFNNGGTAATTAQVFWNGFQTATVSRNTPYLTQWQITDGSTYIWNTYTYSTMALVQTNSTTYNPLARFITIAVTEVSGTSTSVDWVRARKSIATFADPVATIGSQVSNVSANISAQTNVLCNGKSTGSATVTATGGGTPYTYSWSSTPVQATQTATSLPAGSYTVTITDVNGLSATATATITQPVAVIATATSSNITCFNASDGQIIVTGSSGVSPYLFSIDNGVNYQTGGTFSGLSPGAYKVRVIDSNGCESKPVQ